MAANTIKAEDMTTTETTGVAAGASHRRWRRLRFGVMVGLAAATVAPLAALAQADAAPSQSPGDDAYYVTTTASDPALDVSAFSPECIGNAPFIRYSIVPQGFTPSSTTATLDIRDRNGNLVSTQVVDSFSGTIIWPGAAVDASGNATDWPGWTLAPDGESFIPDPTDAFFREGLTIDVTVSPVTATATVSYPPSTSPCANPPHDSPPTTTVCVPGQDNDADPSDDCELSTTGGGPGNVMIIGAAALLAGLLFLTAARRRRHQDASPNGG